MCVCVEGDKREKGGSAEEKGWTEGRGDRVEREREKRRRGRR